MNKKMLLIGGAAALAVYYFFLRKPAGTTTTTTTTPKAPITTNVPVKRETVVVAPAAAKAYVYPAGLQEGDYVKFGTAADVYLLHSGQKLPITEGWWNANAWDKWDTVKFLAPAVALDIPTGSVLS
jgi:hypothetical protein